MPRWESAHLQNCMCRCSLFFCGKTIIALPHTSYLPKTAEKNLLSIFGHSFVFFKVCHPAINNIATWSGMRDTALSYTEMIQSIRQNYRCSVRLCQTRHNLPCGWNILIIMTIIKSEISSFTHCWEYLESRNFEVTFNSLTLDAPDLWWCDSHKGVIHRPPQHFPFALCLPQ